MFKLGCRQPWLLLILFMQKTIVELRLLALKKNTHDIVSRDYWTAVGCKRETTYLHVLHWVTLIIPTFVPWFTWCPSNKVVPRIDNPNFILKSLWPINQPNSDAQSSLWHSFSLPCVVLLIETQSKNLSTMREWQRRPQHGRWSRDVGEGSKKQRVLVPKGIPETKFPLEKTPHERERGCGDTEGRTHP